MLNNLPPQTNVPSGYVRDNETGYVYKEQTLTNRGFTVEKKKQFITKLKYGIEKLTFNEGAICREIGITKHMLTAHLKFDVKLREEYSDLVEQLIDAVEDVAIQEALTNRRAASERKFILEHRRPHIYGKKMVEPVKKAEENDLLKDLLKSLPGKDSDEKGNA